MSTFVGSLVTLGLVILALYILTRLVASIKTHVSIRDHERGLLYASGRFVRVLEPGAHWTLMPFRRVEVLDLRSKVVTVPGQEVLTADNVSVRASVLVGYRIADPRAAFETAQSLDASLYAHAQLALRAIVAALPVEELVAQREALSAQLVERITPQAALLGITLETVGVKDLTFPPPLRQALHQVVEARKAAQASLERARGEMATLRSLANAARMLESNPALMTLRALQGGADGRNTVVLGMGAGVIPLMTPPETGRAGGGSKGGEEDPAT
jgi:regulator of protease activity HflC (stomatin/prohibitin superfamily)